MTPEELNRTMEFIVQSQARLAAAHEQDREERIQSEKQFKALDLRLASLFDAQVRLLESQTKRLDQHEGRLEECEKENRAAQRRHQELMLEMRSRITKVLSRIDRVLEKLTDTMN